MYAIYRIVSWWTCPCVCPSWLVELLGLCALFVPGTHIQSHIKHTQRHKVNWLEHYGLIEWVYLCVCLHICALDEANENMWAFCGWWWWSCCGFCHTTHEGGMRFPSRSRAFVCVSWSVWSVQATRANGDCNARWKGIW